MSAMVTNPLDVDTYESRLQILNVLAQAYAVPNYAPDPMAGDEIQTQWQLDSGRSVIRWWNRINFCLVVWRLQALQSRGQYRDIALTGSLQVKLPKSVTRQILRYYDAVSQFKKGPGPRPELLQLLFWVVHTHTVIKAMRAAKSLVGTLLDGERQFALGWGKVMVKVLAEVNFPTVKAVVGSINSNELPQRVCNAADTDPAMSSSLPEAQRTTVLAIAALYRNRDLSFLYLPLLEIGAVLLKYVIIINATFSPKRPLA